MTVLRPKFKATKPVYNPKKRAITLILGPEVYATLEHLSRLESCKVDQTIIRAINAYIVDKASQDD